MKVMEKCRDDFLKCDEVVWYNGSDTDSELWLSTNAVDWLEEGFSVWKTTLTLVMQHF